MQSCLQYRKNKMRKKLEHILYIDDEADILEVAQMCLEDVGGFRVDTRSNGLDGIAAALELSPDLILIDVMMPDLDGPGTLVKLRQHKELENIPVVFMTARVQPNEIDEYKSIGAAGVFPKPFDPMALSGNIEDLWKKLT